MLDFISILIICSNICVAIAKEVYCIHFVDLKEENPSYESDYSHSQCITISTEYKSAR